LPRESRKIEKMGDFSPNFSKKHLTPRTFCAILIGQWGAMANPIDTYKKGLITMARMTLSAMVAEHPNEVITMPRKFKDGRPAVMMEFQPGFGDNIKGEEAVYFFKFYGEVALFFDKVGTSKVDVVARLRDEIGEYSKKFDIRRVEIHRIMSCGNRPAEGAESALRAELIKQYPEAFRKNDRFFGVDISPAVFDEIVTQYFG
jgi:hypothetical protein